MADPPYPLRYVMLNVLPIPIEPHGKWPNGASIGADCVLHAHASVRTDEELTNLINVQHAGFGALGLLAGTTRWLMLRGLVPAAPARVIWPALIIALGLFMAFGYREVV